MITCKVSLNLLSPHSRQAQRLSLCAGLSDESSAAAAKPLPAAKVKLRSLKEFVASFIVYRAADEADLWPQRYCSHSSGQLSRAAI